MIHDTIPYVAHKLQGCYDGGGIFQESRPERERDGGGGNRQGAAAAAAAAGEEEEPWR